MLKIVKGQGHPLHQVAQTRYIEKMAAVNLPPCTLMQRAGLAIAKLALAIAPHAQRIWIACGPGNNGGDGLEAALHLHRWGKHAFITWLGQPNLVPPDALAAYQRVLHAGITIETEPWGNFDLCIDALLGIGTQLREPQNQMANWMSRLNSGGIPVLAVDIPSGLDPETGQVTSLHVKANHTLSLLTLKPGLFTLYGRDTSGTVWLDQLGIDTSELSKPDPAAHLLEHPKVLTRAHASHKGSYGDVVVVGGATGMTGAALMAASAALHWGAGRVFVGILDAAAMTVNVAQPELMFRPIESLDFSNMTVVCGCGGGQAVHAILFRVLSTSAQLVMDADALNAIACDSHLQATLISRSTQGVATVLTPHPLEAARLLGLTTSQIQNDRLGCAQKLSQRFACTVVLKGSGTVIAALGHTPAINPTGNARLATAGTGDVLAGMIGARLACGMGTFAASCESVYQHGELADTWPDKDPLTASQLARRGGLDLNWSSAH